MRIRLSLVLPLLAALGTRPAAATGAWETFIRPLSYFDLRAEGDTVWCSTGEAGLLRFSRSDRTFVAINREPLGLASNRLSRLFRDRSGRLWVGTTGAGASRLSADGSKWDVVNRIDGLPSVNVTSFASRGDTILIGTTGGIALWDGTQIRGALPDGFNPSPFVNGSDWITGVVIHGDSTWVSTTLGVYRSRFSQGLTASAWTQDTLAGLPKLSSYQNIVADDTTLIALSGNTVRRQRFGNAQPWTFANGVAGGGSVGGIAVRLYEDYGKILLTTDDGVFVWGPGNLWVRLTNQFDSNRNDPKRSFAFAVDRSGTYFAANKDGLRERVGDPDSWLLSVPAGPPGNNLINLATQNGKVYVNTYEEGIGRFDGAVWRNWPFANFTCPLPCDTNFHAPNYAFALLVDRQGEKWFSCWAFAISRLDDSGPAEHFTHHLYRDPLANAERHTTAWAAAADADSGVWFGMDTNNTDYNPIGLEYYDKHGNYVANFSPDSSTVRAAKIHGLTVDKAGRLWVGYTGEGIDIFNIQVRTDPRVLPSPVTVQFSDHYNVQGLVAHGDTVWALTSAELIAYKQTTATRIASYSIPSATANNAVSPLAVARDGTVWVGSANGIRVVHPNGTTQDIDTSNSPLCDGNVRAIAVDWTTGMVWIGTPLGLNRYDPGYRPPPPPPVPQHMKFRVYPNPAWLSSAGIPLSVVGEGHSYSGEVYDLRGRRVATFEGVANQGMVWNGRDSNGEVAGPGLYFFRVRSGGASGTFRVVLLK